MPKPLVHGSHLLGSSKVLGLNYPTINLSVNQQVFWNHLLWAQHCRRNSLREVAWASWDLWIAAHRLDLLTMETPCEPHDLALWELLWSTEQSTQQSKHKQKLIANGSGLWSNFFKSEPMIQVTREVQLFLVSGTRRWATALAENNIILPEPLGWGLIRNRFLRKIPILCWLWHASSLLLLL